MLCLTELKPAITLVAFTQNIESGGGGNLSNRLNISCVYTDIQIKFITESYLTKFYTTKFIPDLFNCH